MSSVSLANLSGPLLNQNSEQSPEVQTSQKSPAAQAGQESLNAVQDQFTPSAQSGQVQASAQAAGLFTVPQTPLFSSAAGSLLGQAPANFPSQTASENSASSPANQTEVVAAAAAPTPTIPPTTDSAYSQQELQPLNEALTSLGLSQQQIQELDQIATITNDFSPAAFTAQAYQLEELALQNSQQATTTANSGNQTANQAASNPRSLAENT
ncbi:MAG: hypothetical protein WA894_01340 [Candidatus Acidiferrum sp.]